MAPGYQRYPRGILFTSPNVSPIDWRFLVDRVEIAGRRLRIKRQRVPFQSDGSRNGCVTLTFTTFVRYRPPPLVVVIFKFHEWQVASRRIVGDLENSDYFTRMAGRGAGRCLLRQRVVKNILHAASERERKKGYL